MMFSDFYCIPFYFWKWNSLIKTNLKSVLFCLKYHVFSFKISTLLDRWDVETIVTVYQWINSNSLVNYHPILSILEFQFLWWKCSFCIIIRCFSIVLKFLIFCFTECITARCFLVIFGVTLLIFVLQIVYNFCCIIHVTFWVYFQVINMNSFH